MTPLLLAFALAAQARPDTAKMVLLEVGVRARTADAELITRTAGLAARQLYSPAALRLALADAVRRVYGLGLFSNVAAETTRIGDGVTVTLAVEEYPRLRSVVFEGYRRVRKKDLEARVKWREGEVLTDRKVFDWRQEILKLYKEKGFLLVKVESEKSEPDSAGRVVLTCRIEEGDPVRIRDIQIHGNEAFTDEQIEIKLTNRQKTWYRKAQLKEDEFVKDLERVVDFYKQRGFIDARVLDYDMKFDAGWVTITIKVSEGIRYHIGTVAFEGDSVMTEPQLRKLVRYRPGSVYNAKLTQATLQDLFGLYSEEGYIYASVVPLEQMRSDTVDITYQITEGRPAQVRLVSIEGNEQTYDKVIRREISSLPGYVFKRSEVMRSQRDIFNLGFFDDVSIDYRRADTAGTIDLIYRVKEKSFFGTVGAGVSYSAQDQFTGYVELQQPNLLGQGLRAGLKVEKGAKKGNVELSFTEPWLFDTPTSAGVNASYVTRSYDYYDKQEIGGGLAFSRPVPLDYTRAYLNLRIADGYVPPSSIRSGYTPTGIQNVYRDTVHKTAFNPGLTLTRDSRDYIYNPLTGSATTYTFDISVGDIRFHRHIFDISHYFPLFWKFGLMGRTRLGYITGFSSADTVPLYERFYAGGTGPDGIRGYGERSVGPLEGGYRVGGKAEAIFTLEYKLRINPQLSFLAFADAGNAWNSLNQFSLSDLKRGAGLGVRIEIPMLGLIGFDFGYGFDKDRPSWEPHFQLGRTF
uniref:Outer membrane protein assembly factor BamA n=1 Tax=candidate division WOR-3 bacterium TaxID=2052148 RepID=A0A7C4GAY6_UNCW3